MRQKRYPAAENFLVFLMMNSLFLANLSSQKKNRFERFFGRGLDMPILRHTCRSQLKNAIIFI